MPKKKGPTLHHGFHGLYSSQPALVMYLSNNDLSTWTNASLQLRCQLCNLQKLCVKGSVATHHCSSNRLGVLLVTPYPGEMRSRQFLCAALALLACVALVSAAEDAGAEAAVAEAPDTAEVPVPAAANVTDAEGAGGAANVTKAGAVNATGTAFADTGILVKNTRMDPPEITVAGLTGLIVAGIFLAIFLPGFMCLWSIQTPQSFEATDRNDHHKKMQ